MNKHGHTKDAENEISLPLDVDKCRRDKVAEGKVESPVSGSGKSDSFTPDPERVEFWRVDP